MADYGDEQIESVVGGHKKLKRVTFTVGTTTSNSTGHVVLQDTKDFLTTDEI